MKSEKVETIACESCGSYPRKCREHYGNRYVCDACYHAIEKHGAHVYDAYAVVCSCENGGDSK